MASTPYIVQTGMGVDIHGADETTAACRAVEAAIGHNSLLFLRHVGIQRAEQILVQVEIACPRPERVDTARVAAVLPVGRVSVATQAGGMLVDTAMAGDPMLIAIAAVRVSVEDT